jgi:predicted amidohydrolase YtcJ
MKILYNAQIYTLDQTNPISSAIAIDKNRIIALGSYDALLTEFDKASTQNLEGRVIIPGLIDSHIHLKHYALSLQKVNCEVPTKEDCLIRISKRAKTTRPGEWILGHGWNQNTWESGFGSAQDLDGVAPENPVYLTAKSLHSSWVNTKALEISGISANSQDPADGRIQRDENGTPTGILLEGASDLITRVLPVPGIDEVMEAIMDAQAYLLEMGLTGIHDFDGQISFTALQKLHLTGKLKIRVQKSIPEALLSQSIDLGIRSGFGDDRLWIGSVKLFADGALGPHTAAMVADYQNHPGNKGMLFMNAEEVFEIGLPAVQNGLSLAIHAIGDRANQEVISGLEKLRKFDNALRHRIEHVQLLQPEDVDRLAENKVIASMQPVHATSDMGIAENYWGERSAYAYAWKALLNQGTTLCFGSDAPVESPNPFVGIHAAVTRRKSDGSPGEDGWYPNQRLTVAEAINGYSQGAAYASGKEIYLGKLKKGFLADLLVLDKDPFTCDAEELQDITPAATMIDGEWVVSSLQ